MKPSALRRLVAAVTLIMTLATLAPSVANAQTRDGSTALVARDATPDQQVRRLYESVLNRDADAPGLNYWVSENQKGLSLRRIADLLTDSNEFKTNYGVLSNRGFVERLYINVQDRPGEKDGVDYWTGLIDTGQLTRGGVVLGFSESPEYRLNNYDFTPLDRLYCAFLLRKPDAAGESYWRDQYLFQNVNLGPIAGAFSESDEFKTKYGSLTDRQFVDLIYKNVLGRPLPLVETEGPNYWTGVLGRKEGTRGSVMVNFSEAQEYKNRFTTGSCPEAGTARPIVANDRGTVLNGGSVVVNWKQNDTVPTGTTVQAISTAAAGTVTDNNNGTFTYKHNGINAAAGTDSFTYTLRSADGVTATATINITILAAGADGIPTAVDDVATADFGKAVKIFWASNDTTDDTVSVLSVTTPSNGSVTSNADSTFTYTPAAGFSGVDTFQYTLTDASVPADTSTATVTVTVRPSAGPDDGVSPTATADRAFTYKNTNSVIKWDANDSLVDNAYLAEFTQPEHGVVVDNSNGTFTYTPETDYTVTRTVNGLVADSFTYTLRDDDAGVSTATVEVYVMENPQCEVFMNYPYQPKTGGVDNTRLELFFSTVACTELYSGTLDVLWTDVKLNGNPVSTTSEANSFVREFVAVTTTPPAVSALHIQGFATLTQNGNNAVKIEFELDFDWNGTAWVRNGSRYQGREIVNGAKTDDVTIFINPLLPS